MEKKVVVITGGGSGIGLETAKNMPKDKIIVLAGRTVAKLENAVATLQTLGYEAYACACDTSSRYSVHELAKFAAQKGTVTNVINAAGLSPAMASPEKLLRVNALGTVYMNQEFANVMKEGSVIVDVSSNSAYVLPSFIIPKRAFKLAETDEDAFMKKLLRMSNLPKDDYSKSGLAYALSKNFAIWYAQKCAYEFGPRGIRVVSVSPGLVATNMGNLEAEEGSKMLQFGAEHRMGKPEELGYAVASIADERNGYLSGVDILCDGGCTNGKKFRWVG